MFYTYLHYRNDTGQVFYVGKGCGRRSHSKSDRNNHWRNVATKCGYSVELAARWDTAPEALQHEIFLIEMFRELGHPLVNMTNGGDGSSGFKPGPETIAKKSIVMKEHWGDAAARSARMIVLSSEETRSKMSASAKMRFKNPDQLSAITEINRSRARDPARRSAASVSMRAIWSDDEYRQKTSAKMRATRGSPEGKKSMSETAKKIWMDPVHAEKMRAIHDSESFRSRMREVAAINNRKTSKPVECVNTGARYPSTLAAAKATGVAQGSISAACRGKTKTAGGMSFRFTASPEPL